ncbi:MAG: VOC family protein [Candidatus Sulfotelmatobacter sp.]
MVPVQSLFEAHLTVADLTRSMKFYGETLGIELAAVLEQPKVAFYWMGGRGKSMLGLWEVGNSPQRMSLHIAFSVELGNLLTAPGKLRSAGITPLDAARNPTDEPVVFGWMPAASVFFRDPDENLLEYIAMLPDRPQRELGVVSWSVWTRR